MSLTTIIGPLIMNTTFSYFTSSRAPIYFPGIHFLMGAVCMFLSILLVHRVLSKERTLNPVAAPVANAAEG